MAASELTLVIGDKNFSSWSLRPWLLLKVFGIPFREEWIPLRQPDTTARIETYSPAGMVPILKDGISTVWDTLAIAEHVAERFPDRALWPGPSAARALARSITAEMHSGFAALRTECPMNVMARMEGYVPTLSVARNIGRIEAIWADARARFGKGGPFLFGGFSIPDAFYAPVCTRLRTYGIKVSKASQDYCAAIFALPAMQEWERGAHAETKALL
jgi:glutathione S-transferase